MTTRRMHVAWLGMALACVGTRLPADDLYSPQTYSALAADHRAWRPGDNLTVVVTEMATATADARTTTDKAGNLSGTASLHPTAPQQATFGLNDTFNGGGTIERSGKVGARITVVVQEVDPAGNLHVRGQQQIVINGDHQKLSVEGRVRPQDVGTDNTVLSSRLSDAKIAYTGDGVLKENQRPGFFTRLLSWLRIL
jgi:flagellar L-ring protein precursor FlgH